MTDVTLRSHRHEQLQRRTYRFLTHTPLSNSDAIIFHGELPAMP
jgi:hypothetical protein